MAIRIQDFPEPLTLAARESSVRRVLIESEEYHQIVHELRRYCNAQISGRSFLIAGHRGSGKTTFTLSAFEQVWREAQAGELRMRPLMVQLLGPSLLPGFDERDVAEPAKDGTKTEKKLTEFETVLVQFTLALHRAVVNELAQAYRERMKLFATLPAERTRADLERANVCLEAPGQLALELDEYPGKSRLREFWRRARALPEGVLPMGRRSVPPVKGDVSNQGINELVALCSVSEAYRRISGTIRASKKDEASAKSLTTRTREKEFKGKDLFAPMITLLTGGAVATGVAAAIKPDHIELAAVAGVITALASAIVARSSVVRSQQRSVSQEELFLPNLSVSTLDRVLPVLLDRVRDAGLAPIFIIDELDKVKNLSKRIPKMVKRLKKLVAEKAFFCFLTDRRYFEEMSSRNAVTPHSLESTYFTNQVFITFRHKEFHTFIDELLMKPEAFGPPGASSDAQQRLDEEIVDHALLPYILLHAAEMHPIDLRRRISNIRGPNSTVSLEPGEVRSNLNRLQLLVQVAIELLLESDEMELELAREPAFRRLAHDALYFISRKWQLGATEVRLDAKGRDEFHTYLTDRMKTEGPPRNAGANGKPSKGKTRSKQKLTDGQSQAASQQANGSEEDEEEEEILRPPFTAEEGEFLWNQVCDLANLLARQPEAIHDKAAKKERVAPQVLDALRSIPGPLLERVGRADVFRFRYHRAGRETKVAPKRKESAAGAGTHAEPSSAEHRPPQRGIELETAFIDRFNAAVGTLTADTINFGTLGAGCGVIATSPAWVSVELALRRLTSTPGEYPERQDDMSNVRQFADVLRRSASTIALAIFCGWALGELRRDSSDRRELAGLQVLSQALGLKALREDTVHARIQEFSVDLTKRVGVEYVPSQLQVSGVSKIKKWESDILLLEEESGSRLPAAMQITAETKQKAWEFWSARLRQPDVSPTFEAVICAAARRGPSRLLAFPPEEMPARAWSIAFYEGFRARKTQVGDAPIGSTPKWLAAAALRQLRFALEPQSLKGLGMADAYDLEDLAVSDPSRLAKQPRRNALVITREGSESEKWKPVKEWPALVMRRKELEQLMEWIPRDALFRLLEIEWPVFDWSSWPEPERLVTSSDLEFASTLLQAFVGLHFRFPAIVPRAWRGELPPFLFPVEMPGSFDELFTRVARETLRTAPA
jgi:hypothetical protein